MTKRAISTKMIAIVVTPVALAMVVSIGFVAAKVFDTRVNFGPAPT